MTQESLKPNFLQFGARDNANYDSRKGNLILNYIFKSVSLEKLIRKQKPYLVETPFRSLY